ncbi:MAG: DNA helicase RecQ [Phycisphaerales bacterium JB041]
MIPPAGPKTDSTQPVLDVVRRVWGFDSLRPLQHDAIDAALQSRDALVVLPTGGGKSLCYQVPPLVADELTVVISPLIALMKDQVDGLVLNGYPAAAMHSATTDEDLARARDSLRDGSLRLLFVSPERLLSEGFTDWLARLPNPSGAPGVRRFAIDEAHCISAWGHDFRPEYRRLAALRRRFPDACIHAFTATATERVRQDIIEQLALRDPAVLVGTFDRPNLTYRVVPRVDRDGQIAEVLSRHKGDASIVYCISRKDTEAVAEMLRERGFNAGAYHAGLDTDTRKRVQDDFIRERLDVVAATVAFGMGIDRSNVRCVLHAAMPKSVEAYQQETGRAGRDGLDAECVLLYSGADAARWSRLVSQPDPEGNDPSPETVRAQLELLHEMQRFAAGMTCRHKVLSEHFGQPYPFPNCNACDVCLNEVDAVDDATVVAQKIISCVARALQHSGTSFGAAHIVDVLRGSRAQKILQRGHEQLSTHGLLRDVPRPTLVSYVNQLLDLGVLDRAPGEFPTLVLNEASREVHTGARTVALFMPRGPAEAAGRRRRDREEIELSPREHELFDSLRALRREIADAHGVPPYVVFNDQTLQELSAVRPGSIETIGRVRGVGARKLETFAPAFLAHIREWCEIHELDLDARLGSGTAASTAAPDKPRTLSPAKRRSFSGFERGESIEAVAEAGGLAVRTVGDHLADWIESRRPSDISAWVAPADYDRIASAAAEVGTDLLRPIFDRLNGRAPYEQIKLVVAHLRARA